MEGVPANDTYFVDNAGDQVIEATSGGTDTVYSTVNYTLAPNQEVEFLRVYGSAGLSLTTNDHSTYLIGGAGTDSLTGGAGNDRLDGAAGADIMAGGIGNDSYYVDNIGDQLHEEIGQGSDIVYAATSWTMALDQEIENLMAYGPGATSDITLGGNNLNNILTGGSGNDTLNGGAGNDRLKGGAGN